MNSLPASLRSVIGGVLFRLRLNRALFGMGLGLLFAAAAALALVLLRFTGNLPGAGIWVLLLLGAGAIAGVLWSFWKGPSPADAAALIDCRLNLPELATTALAFADQTEPIYALQRKQTERELTNAPAGRIAPLRPPRSFWVGVALSLAVLAGAFYPLVGSPRAAVATNEATQEDSADQTTFADKINLTAQQWEASAKLLKASETADPPAAALVDGLISRRYLASISARQTIESKESREP